MTTATRRTVAQHPMQTARALRGGRDAGAAHGRLLATDCRLSRPTGGRIPSQFPPREGASEACAHNKGIPISEGRPRAVAADAVSLVHGNVRCAHRQPTHAAGQTRGEPPRPGTAAPRRTHWERSTPLSRKGEDGHPLTSSRDGGAFFFRAQRRRPSPNLLPRHPSKEEKPPSVSVGRPVPQRSLLPKRYRVGSTPPAPPPPNPKSPSPGPRVRLPPPPLPPHPSLFLSDGQRRTTRRGHPPPPCHLPPHSRHSRPPHPRRPHRPARHTPAARRRRPPHPRTGDPR